ncbi:MAG: DUF262 domain-containing protein [Bacteroidales bacterium]|nr:DUF262 domain-containing protein [Bacteroidales bacterium]
MEKPKYAVNQYLIDAILALLKSGEIAIPEIQRPFVWETTKVRDLMDSLYRGYPIGYLIAWKNPNVRLKDGTYSEGKKVLIDGQQRVTAMGAAILGMQVINKEYQRTRIKIAFNPITETFEVQTPIMVKDPTWIPDIAEVFAMHTNTFNLITDYMAKNSEADKEKVIQSINSLFSLGKRQIGMIDLESDLDIEVVTEIFIRINSQGVILSQADFAMSKIASSEQYNGHILRKAIDYFCHMAAVPDFYNHIVEVDKEFTSTDFFQKMIWLKDEVEDLYDPDYTDMLRVAFTTQFHRGKLADLVSLLSGRNFESRTFEESIAEESFQKLKEGLLTFMNESNFNRFLMIIKSAGFIRPWMIRSKNAINFAYILYLTLRKQGYEQALIESYIRKWFVMSVLTSRYSGSPESTIDYDIRNIAEKTFPEYYKIIEDGILSDAYWNVTLVNDLATSISSAPVFHVYLASQVKINNKGFLSRDITVSQLISNTGDIHHIFPKNYLKKSGLGRSQYNQIANYVYMQSEINIRVSDKPPSVYFGELKEQASIGGLKFGGIQSMNELLQNLDENCIPHDIFDMNVESYSQFLEKRRRQMARKIREYYYTL